MKQETAKSFKAYLAEQGTTQKAWAAKKKDDDLSSLLDAGLTIGKKKGKK